MKSYIIIAILVFAFAVVVSAKAKLSIHLGSEPGYGGYGPYGGGYGGGYVLPSNFFSTHLI